MEIEEIRKHAFQTQGEWFLHETTVKKLFEIENKWIDVGRRLPENGERVIVKWHPGAHVKHQVSIETLIDEDGFRIAAVIEWMPLPTID